MLHDFTIIHRRKPLRFDDHTDPVWSTCLRSLAFTARAASPHPQDEIHTQHQAYRFLLEIVCGLHSPITGETEVFGQFKTFAQEWIKREPKRAPLVQKLLNDAKAIRSKYLSNLGTQSYGSWVRKNLKAKKVHVLGAGNLAQEIYPYLAKQAETVIHSRSPHKSALENTKAIAEKAFDRGALVIAAPMTAAEIRKWLNNRDPEQIFDLRETSECDALPSTAPQYGLHEIFAEIARTKARLTPLLKEIKREIVERSEKIAAQAQHRPLGWDDLCA